MPCPLIIVNELIFLLFALDWSAILWTLPVCATLIIIFKGNTKFWYGVMNSVQMNILGAYAIQQYSVIVFAVEIESKVVKF